MREVFGKIVSVIGLLIVLAFPAALGYMSQPTPPPFREFMIGIFWGYGVVILFVLGILMVIWGTGLGKKKDDA